jgi:hypothetical protein
MKGDMKMKRHARRSNMGIAGFLLSAALMEPSAIHAQMGAQRYYARSVVRPSEAKAPSNPSTKCDVMEIGYWSDGAVIASGRTGNGTVSENALKAQRLCANVGKPGICRANLDMDGKQINDGAWSLVSGSKYQIGLGHLYAASCS